MEGEQGSAGSGDGADGAGDGVGDVVEFEVEEDFEVALEEAVDDLVSGGVVELHADLEPAAGVLELVDEAERFVGGGEVEGYDEAV